MGLITVRRRVGYGDVWVHDYGEIKEGGLWTMPAEEALAREDWEIIGPVPEVPPAGPPLPPPPPPKMLSEYLKEKAEAPKVKTPAPTAPKEDEHVSSAPNSDH